MQIVCCDIVLKDVLGRLWGAALLAEYEDLLGRESIWRQAKLTAAERDAFLDIFLSVCQWTRIYYAWRPNLGDEADNHRGAGGRGAGRLSRDAQRARSAWWGAEISVHFCGYADTTVEGANMSALIIRLPEEKRTRLKLVAKSRKVSVTKLIEEMATSGRETSSREAQLIFGSEEGLTCPSPA